MVGAAALTAGLGAVVACEAGLVPFAIDAGVVLDILWAALEPFAIDAGEVLDILWAVPATLPGEKPSRASAEDTEGAPGLV